MNRFSQNVYDAERMNQAVAVMGGATAPAFEAVSSLGTASPWKSADILPLAGFDSFSKIHAHRFDMDAVFLSEKPTFEPAIALLRAASLSSSVVDEPAGFAPLSASPVARDPELLTRFDTLDSEDLEPFPPLSGESRTGSDGGGEAAVPGNAANPDSGFLALLLAQVEAASDNVATGLDGGTQGAVRELLSELSPELSRSIPAQLEENMASAGRELVAQTTDCFGEPAAFIDGIYSSMGQSIGSIAFPEAGGPLLLNLKSELTGLAA